MYEFLRELLQDKRGGAPFLRPLTFGIFYIW